MSKIKTLEGLEQISTELKEQDKKIVTTNGAFDILHVGHVRYLKEAKALGDILIVAVNSDESIKKYKDEKRPLVPLAERMELLESLEFIDYIFSFEEETPMTWLEKIKPNVHVKGGDYKQPLIEQDFVEKNGGKIVLIKEVEGKSTTNLLEKIRLL